MTCTSSRGNSKPTSLTIKLFSRKLKSRWSKPFKLINIYLYRATELQDKRMGKKFNINGQRVKQFMGATMNNQKDDLFLIDATR